MLKTQQVQPNQNDSVFVISSESDGEQNTEKTSTEKQDTATPVADVQTTDGNDKCIVISDSEQPSPTDSTKSKAPKRKLESFLHKAQNSFKKFKHGVGLGRTAHQSGGQTGEPGPSDAENQTRFRRISTEILEFMQANEQHPTFRHKKEELARALERAISRAIMPGIRIFVVGSSLNGFGRRTSDLDMCLMIDPRAKNLSVVSALRFVNKALVMQILRDVKKLLARTSFARRFQLIPARVPILKFNDRFSGSDCDLNVNNLTGIRNTYLLLAYSRHDARVRPMVMCVKEWAHQNDINDAPTGTLSSYAIALMVIHYLQCGAKPRVLPSLQQAHPSSFEKLSDLDELRSRALALQQTSRVKSHNTQQLAPLLVGFFRYFAHEFDWADSIMSVRLATVLSVTTNHNDNWKNRPLKIEEPFDLNNVAHAAHMERKIKSAFQKADGLMRRTVSLYNLIKRKSN